MIKRKRSFSARFHVPRKIHTYAGAGMNSTGSNGRFSVASYNIHRCIGIDKRYDPERIIRVMQELQVDIIGLQEVDCQYFRPPRPVSVEILYPELPGLHYPCVQPTLWWSFSPQIL